MLTSTLNSKTYSEKQICIFKILFSSGHYNLQPSHYSCYGFCDNKTKRAAMTSFLYLSPEDKVKGQFTKIQRSAKVNLKADSSICLASSNNTPTMYDNSWHDIFKETVIQGQLMKESFYSGGKRY